MKTDRGRSTQQQQLAQATVSSSSWVWAGVVGVGADGLVKAGASSSCSRKDKAAWRQQQQQQTPACWQQLCGGCLPGFKPTSRVLVMLDLLLDG